MGDLPYEEYIPRMKELHDEEGCPDGERDLLGDLVLLLHLRLDN